MPDSLTRLAGWSAYAHAVLTVLNVVTISLLFTVGGFWGPVNDGNGVLWALSFIPIMVLWRRRHRAVHGPASLVTTLVGILAMGAFALLQFLLVIGAVRFEQTIGAILTLGGVQGVALLAGGLLARAGQTLPRRVTWAMMIYGAAYAATAVGFWIGGMWHPLASAGFAAGTAAGLVWSVGLGRILRRGQAPLAAALSAGGS